MIKRMIVVLVLVGAIGAAWIGFQSFKAHMIAGFVGATLNIYTQVGLVTLMGLISSTAS
jgi:hypothetical protein